MTIIAPHVYQISHLNSYFTHRLEKVRELRWEAGPVIPTNFINQDKLSLNEKQYFANYSELLTEYNEMLGLDITSDVEVSCYFVCF